MSLKSRFFSILTLAIAVAAFATISFAQETRTETAPAGKADKRIKRDAMRGDRRMGRAGRGGDFDRHGGGFHGIRGIDLTDAQKAQIRAIRESNKPDAAIRAELKAIHDSRKAGTEITAEQKDRRKAIHEQQKAKAKGVHDQIQNVLTADQKTTLEKRRDEMKQKREEFRQKREEFRKTRPAKPAVTTAKIG